MKTGKQWEKIFKEHITKENIEDLHSFKSNSINHKISLWNPETNGTRYLKMLIYNLFSTLTKEQKIMISNCNKRDFGNPVSIEREGENICLDYIQSSLEASFIDSHFSIEDKKVLEIGAGYGRTCHTLISNFNIDTYTICDLENCLDLSRRYLKEVLSELNYSKIKFIKPEDLIYSDDNFDLCINIDSFAEMDKEDVVLYLSFIDKNCNSLYTKNPVGKYIDSEILGDKDKESISLALKSGILNDIVEIHNEESVEINSQKFLEAYTPSDEWSVFANSWAPPISYYWQALYKKGQKIDYNK